MTSPSTPTLTQSVTPSTTRNQVHPDARTEEGDRPRAGTLHKGLLHEGQRGSGCMPAEPALPPAAVPPLSKFLIEGEERGEGEPADDPGREEEVRGDDSL
jgi:hypothetical protein